MDKDAPRKIAALIAQEIMTDHGRTPAERVLRRHGPSISAWREQGWTWGQIAALLSKGGVQLKDGSPVTERYLAAVFSRIRTKVKTLSQSAARSKTTPQPSNAPAVSRKKPPATANLASPSSSPPFGTSTDRDRSALRSRMRASHAARD